MALIDKASLLMVPSVYEDGTLYNVLPSGNKAPDETGNHNGYDQTRADFTFSRGSNLAATRVNASGLIEKGRENLLLQSNQFDTTWQLTNAPTLTSGQSGYDGSNDAWKLEASTTGSSRSIHQLVSTSGVQVFSVYVKAGTTSWIRLNLSGIGNRYFDIGNGIVGGSGSMDGFITDVGGGWYRCSVLGNGSSTAPYIFLASDNGNLAVNAGDNIYIQDAQLEYGLAASSYLDSGATTATAGVLENTPRIDYSSGAGALLLEPQRTNLIPQSEYFGSYTPLSATITDNVATSPEGVINAASFIETTASGRHRTQTNSFAVTSGSTYTLSMFAKIASGSRLLCLNADYLFNARAYFNLVSGSVEGIDSGSASIEDYGNGWYRCSITGTSSITGSSIAYFGLEDGASDNGYVGDGTSGHYWYGIQAEAGSHVSSYVPTYGSAATRGADSCNNTSATTLIGQTEGTIYWEGIINGAENNYSNLITSERSTATGFSVLYKKSGSEFQCAVFDGSTKGQCNGGSVVIGQKHKLAYAYKSGNFALYVDGVQVATSTQTWTPPGTIDELYLADPITFFGYKESNQHSQAIVFNERLSNTELATLTTL